MNGPNCVPGSETRKVAAACHLADGWLAKQVQAGHCELPLMPRSEKCVLHGHCHQKALLGASASAPVLKLDPRPGRDGAGRWLLRHGRLVRLRDASITI